MYSTHESWVTKVRSPTSLSYAICEQTRRAIVEARGKRAAKEAAKGAAKGAAAIREKCGRKRKSPVPVAARAREAQRSEGCGERDCRRRDGVLTSPLRAGLPCLPGRAMSTLTSQQHGLMHLYISCVLRLLQNTKDPYFTVNYVGIAVFSPDLRRAHDRSAIGLLHHSTTTEL